jgi:hypothetical protein
MTTKSIGALFIALLIILAVNPQAVNNIYNTILGRVCLIGLVVFFSMNNITLGLLVALAIITASKQFGSFVEGMDNIGEDNVTTKGKKIVLTKSKTKNLNKDLIKMINKMEVDGIDKEDIKNAIMSKDSKSIPVDPNTMKSDDVTAFKQSMLSNSSSLTEGFCPCAASVI